MTANSQYCYNELFTTPSGYWWLFLYLFPLECLARMLRSEIDPSHRTWEAYMNHLLHYKNSLTLIILRVCIYWLKENKLVSCSSHFIIYCMPTPGHIPVVRHDGGISIDRLNWTMHSKSSGLSTACQGICVWFRTQKRLACVK